MLKLSQKKTCENCKALLLLQYSTKCELGYDFDAYFKPLEPCPKPKTYADFVQCVKWYMKKGD